jgi:hypothetical protein
MRRYKLIDTRWVAGEKSKNKKEIQTQTYCQYTKRQANTKSRDEIERQTDTDRAK